MSYKIKTTNARHHRSEQRKLLGIGCRWQASGEEVIDFEETLSYIYVCKKTGTMTTGTGELGGLDETTADSIILKENYLKTFYRFDWNSPENCEYIQEKLFELGYRWDDFTRSNKTGDQVLSIPGFSDYIYVCKNRGEMSWGNSGSDCHREMNNIKEILNTGGCMESKLLDKLLYVKWSESSYENQKNQENLFSMGYSWISSGQNISDDVPFPADKYICIDTTSKNIWFSSSMSKLGVLVTIVPVETYEFKKEEVLETVELNGETYSKKDLEEALKKLTPVNN